MSVLSLVKKFEKADKAPTLIQYSKSSQTLTVYTASWYVASLIMEDGYEPYKTSPGWWFKIPMEGVMNDD